MCACECFGFPFLCMVWISVCTHGLSAHPALDSPVEAAAWLLTELGLKRENNIKKKKADTFGDVDINMAWGKKKPSGTTGYVPGL